MKIPLGPAPALGADRVEILRSLGYSDDEAGELTRSGAFGKAQP